MNINIREAKFLDAEGIAKVSVSSWKSTYAGIMEQEFLSSLSYQSRKNKWQQSIEKGEDIIYVAEEDEKIVGFVSGGKERTGQYPMNGEIYAIYLLEAYQGQGIGTKLLRPFLQQLTARNVDSLLVWVLQQNPFKRFYQKLGASLIDQKEVQVGNRILIEEAYGWDRMETLQQLIEKEC
ncbi:GNAT family N-acetyltransferase [Salinibacillus xinjiangensis]|nr:GNAT family N-acetyltransferase [Salinibacillus xinjiangensis]